MFLAGALFTVNGASPAVRFRDPLGITCDLRSGEILVADTGNREVAIFGSDGVLNFRFTHFIERGGRMVPGSPRCALQASDGRIFITDALSTAISVANPRGEVMSRVEPASLLGLTGKRLVPGYLAWDPKGQLHVTITGDAVGVLVLDPSLQVVRFVNGPTRERGELVAPTGIAIDPEGRMYVTDPGAAWAVTVLSPEGDFLGGFGQHETGWENFSFPSGITITQGILWIADSVRQVVKGMDREGHPIYVLGGKGIGSGEMLYPVSVASDGGRRLYVLERAGARVQAFELPAEPAVAGF